MAEVTENNQLRKNLASLDPGKVQEIKDAYYKAAEGLQTLFNSLELADLDCIDGPGSPLLTESMVAMQAYQVFKESRIGQVL